VQQNDRLDNWGNVWAKVLSMKNAAETISPFVGRPRNNRSAVSNGNRLFAPDVTDGRTCAARRFRDILEQIQFDLGGDDRLSEGQRQLCRRAATMSMQCELMEAEAVAGRVFDVDCFGQLCDRLGRCLQRLGLERVSRDVTPSLQSYLQAKANHG
jgi:hypothetical protein